MITATITKIFHRDSVVMKQGDMITEKMDFVDYDHAAAWGRGVNRNHECVPYHVGSFFIDSKNFCCFDLSEIIEAYGYFDINEIK